LSVKNPPKLQTIVDISYLKIGFVFARSAHHDFAYLTWVLWRVSS